MKRLRHISTYAIIGVILTLFNFVIYAILARIINNNNFLWISSIISYTSATFLAFFLHSRITWKERSPNKSNIINFFLWNFLTAFAISPFLTWFFSLLTPVHTIIYNLSTRIHLPFDFNFIESTNIFILVTIVTMTLNYLFYDRIVFNNQKEKTSIIKNMNKKKIVLSLLIYAIPVIFFIISYFLVTTSGEDIYQGAGTLRSGIEINILEKAKAAFEYNGRLTDMYAWSVIGFFDYHFQFGPDLFFRLLDVILALSVVYMLTYFIIDHKLQLTIHDATLFCLTFLLIIAFRYGIAFVSGFSMIHNYVILSFITLLFSIPFINALKGKPPKKHLALLAIGLLVLGVAFGMSATLTPLAFLLTAIFYCLIKHQEKPWKKPWLVTGIIGITIGFLISNILGPGVSQYATSSTYVSNLDYVSFSDFISDPIVGSSKLIDHFVYNLSYLVGPLIFILIVSTLFIKNPRKTISKALSHPQKNTNLNIILAISIFAFFHVLSASQIYAPFRLLIPAYLAILFPLGHLVFPLFNKTAAFRTSVITIAILLTIARSIILSLYFRKTSVVLNEVKNSSSSELCIDYSRVSIKTVPIVYLSQESMLDDWGYPEPIYNKAVSICQP